MKNKILTTATILIIAMAMTGIVAAREEGQGGQGVGGGCPSRNSLNSHTQTYDNLFADKTVSGTVVTYLLNTVANGESVIGYCVYPTPGFEGNVNDVTPLYTGWEKWPKHGDKDYFGFERGTGGNEIPIDGATNIQVGKANFGESGLPRDEVILFHIKDPEECGSNRDERSEDTCWRRPGSPPLPVPEIATISLVSAGIIGLFIVARKYRKKN